LDDDAVGGQDPEVFLSVGQVRPAEELAVPAREVEIGPHENMGETPFHLGSSIIGLDPLDHGLPEGPVLLRDEESAG
jgi:hypothetical protein